MRDRPFIVMSARDARGFIAGIARALPKTASTIERRGHMEVLDA
jgi:hypothetical protein